MYPRIPAVGTGRNTGGLFPPLPVPRLPRCSPQCKAHLLSPTCPLCPLPVVVVCYLIANRRRLLRQNHQRRRRRAALGLSRPASACSKTDTSVPSSVHRGPSLQRLAGTAWSRPRASRPRQTAFHARFFSPGTSTTTTTTCVAWPSKHVVSWLTSHHHQPDVQTAQPIQQAEQRLIIMPAHHLTPLGHASWPLAA